MKPNTTKPDMRWFEEGRFGLFMHWGLYALNGESEWLMYNSEMTPEEYRERFFDYFEPDLFDPKEWARLAKDAGMKYFVITAKHHDGFCLWDTKTTDFNAMKAPLCRRDLLKDIIEAFRAEGLKVGVYCTLPDWSRPDMPITDRHPLRNRPAERDCSTFAPFLREQVRELLTNYGKIDLIWFDGNYLETQHVWDAPGLNEMIRKMQPGILINRLPGFSDFHSPEWTIPKDGIRDEDGDLLPWEGCQVFNGGWCYPRYDRQHRKTAKQVVEMLIRHASRGGNLLLNAGPTSRGCFDEYETEIFRALSRWMKWNGRSITGCTVAPTEFPEPENGLYTYNPKTNRLYLHLFSWPDHRVILPNLGGKVKFAQLLETGCELMLTEYDPTNVHRTRLQEGDLLVKLPIESPKTEVPVIELFLK